MSEVRTWRVTVVQRYEYRIQADSFEDAMEVAMDTDWQDHAAEAEIKVEKDNG